MTHDSQRIAIAEACGLPKPYSRWSGADGDTLCHSVTVEDGLKRAKPIPDYLVDLNAMHEAEQCLWRKDYLARDTFVDHLARILNPVHGYRDQSGQDLLDATAAQRAEAFLRTLGKWEDDK